jgi:hypothetical protein
MSQRHFQYPLLAILYHYLRAGYSLLLLMDMVGSCMDLLLYIAYLSVWAYDICLNFKYTSYILMMGTLLNTLLGHHQLFSFTNATTT